MSGSFAFPPPSLDQAAFLSQFTPPFSMELVFSTSLLNYSLPQCKELFLPERCLLFNLVLPLYGIVRNSSKRGESRPRKTSRGLFWSDEQGMDKRRLEEATSVSPANNPFSLFSACLRLWAFYPLSVPSPKTGGAATLAEEEKEEGKTCIFWGVGFCDTHSTPLTHSHAASCQGEKRSVATLHKYHGNSPRPSALSSSLPILGGSLWRIFPLYHLICLCQREGGPRRRRERGMHHATVFRLETTRDLFSLLARRRLGVEIDTC